MKRGLRESPGETDSEARLGFVRINGSQHVFTKPGKRERIVIPFHGNEPLKIGLLCNLMKIAELTETDL